MVHPALSWVMVQLLGKGNPSNVRQRDLTRSLGPGDGGEGKELLQRLVSASHSSKMAPMKKLARSLKERIDNIVTYCTHGITNAVAEGINNKIMSIKRRARGYRNIENFKTAVLLYCGGLDLDP